ncbi:hypothetical protein H310_10683 [Aphanomyces invadans]|uniref:Uncharacterized protein n=1 Tax=Aphanomyces invadans TaxID=157072 RepID=A0A024TPV9_9STRA|nr:hypothetical protein H310_10683 [Aphanomyces invadans]ETV96034.1 hypothetical protein H310_10683 [Aphanomyces invadans]|eukprot:XP_008875345.1 hypothetical protein H310_10683 [Aphanomyces invadans]
MTTPTQPSFPVVPRPYRGPCQYKGGRCPNERTLKRTGEPHTLCEAHRVRHNKIQCKSDTKMRQLKRVMALRKQAARNVHTSTLLVPRHGTPPVKVDTPPATVDFLPEEIFIFMGMMGLRDVCDDSVEVSSVDLDGLWLL